MVPLLMEEGYNALYGIISGLVLESDSAFEGKMKELYRELGQQGKVQ